jgi:NAD(P)-dependent dehydrogenase (short-subunit alcohol dehydrogenase family)
MNNAGIYIGKPFTEYTLDDYSAITAVNLAGFFHMTQRVIPIMVAQGSGHVVNISTSLVDHADSSRPAALAASPRAASLPLHARWRSSMRPAACAPTRCRSGDRDPAHDPASYEALRGLHPLGRVGDFSDVVDGILYLERATFVTGETLHIDGGQAAGH